MVELKKKNEVYIILSAIVTCLIVYYFEQIPAVDYLTKTFIKIAFFILVPLFYRKIFCKDNQEEKKDSFNKKNLVLGLALGIGAFSIVYITYLLLQNYIDVASIVKELQDKSKITAANFLFVGIYITLGNSFLEEFFFRGFIFLELFKIGRTRISYLISSILFAVYHMSIIKTWFSPVLIGLCLFGLVVIGIVFDWIDTKSKGIWNSWIVHILADMAIIAIGFTIIK